MAHTFTQLYAHVVFCPKHRRALISPRWEQRLFRYIHGIVAERDQQLLAINGIEDHIHLDLRLRPAMAVADLVRDIKACSSRFIRESGLCDEFRWQVGYGAFSHSHRSRERVIRYIERQKQHHGRQTFRSEFVELLDRHGIPYEARHLFDWLDTIPGDRRP